MVFIVTEQLVLDRTTLDKNLLSANLKPAIILAQKVEMTTICGDKLVDEANTKLIRENILKTREAQFLKEHDEYCDGSHHYE